ncbi:MAG: hypothetical protein M0D54_09160 [Hyphomonadaceae bacterium JAD_PAG50586_4]|nr:MAG: hypothetical protein M0D54_09160 [Hyphomonadaceae bacterium JAD_PAG50586_4]
MSKASEKNDRGAALITVLTMMAVMATLAIVVVDAANMSLRRTGNMVRMEQTRWYLLGAEAYAVARLGKSIAGPRPPVSIQMSGRTGPLYFRSMTA